MHIWNRNQCNLEYHVWNPRKLYFTPQFIMLQQNWVIFYDDAIKIALKSTDPIEARRVKQKGYSQLTGAILDSIFCLFFFLLAINCCLHVKITSLWTLFACLNVFVEADRIRRIGIDPVCSESCLTECHPHWGWPAGSLLQSCLQLWPRAPARA